MAGETDLQKLLKTMSPELQSGEWVFATFESAVYGDHAELEPLVAVQEAEGLTLVIPKHKALSNDVLFDGVYKMITLQVHSSLEAVGLTAVFATKLAEHGLSANVVAGYFHDHIFVQAGVADKAMVALMELQQ